MPHESAGSPPHFIEARLRPAVQLAAARRHGEAIAILRGVLAREPAHVAARCLIAAVLHDSGQSAGALAELDASPVIDHASAQETRATILLALNRAPEAERAARA